MKTQRLIIAVLATMFMLACNLPLFVPATQAPATLASATSTFTPLPALPVFTSTPTLVPTPTIPEVTPVSSNVNCRSGPDVAYSAVSYINLSEVAQIAGRNDDSSWWYVRDPHNSGNFCWVSALVVTTLGNLSGLAVIPPPEAIVIKVTVDASVGGPVYCGGPNVIQFSGKITTNGATKATFQWEITGDKTNTTSPQTLNFKSATTKDAPDPGAYSADCGNYTITLHVTSPNNISASKNFKVKP